MFEPRLRERTQPTLAKKAKERIRTRMGWRSPFYVENNGCLFTFRTRVLLSRRDSCRSLGLSVWQFGPCFAKPASAQVRSQ